MADRFQYQVQIEGWIGERWIQWFDNTTICTEQTANELPVTTLTGTFDQAALRGLLSKVWDLNLTVLSVTRIESRGA